MASPPIISPCYFGIDTPHRDELVAAVKKIGEMNDMLGTDSLAFLSLAGLTEAIGLSGNLCRACFDDDYPIDITEQEGA